MPRTSNRGGARTGAVGQTFGNRTDMNQPKMVATGQAYGVAGQQAASESAVPLPNNQGQMAAMAQGASQTAAQPQPQAGQADQVYPGELGDFHRPTDLPGQPVTHGSPLGPGAGPEAMGILPRQSNLAQTIANLAQQSGNPSIMALAQKAQAQNQPSPLAPNRPLPLPQQQQTPQPVPQPQPQQVMTNGA